MYKEPVTSLPQPWHATFAFAASNGKESASRLRATPSCTNEGSRVGAEESSDSPWCGSGNSPMLPPTPPEGFDVTSSPGLLRSTIRLSVSIFLGDRAHPSPVYNHIASAVSGGSAELR